MTTGTQSPHRNAYTIGWICAIDTEYTAARSFLEEKYEPLDWQAPADNNSYTLGRIGKHNVVVAICAEYGIAEAAMVTRDLVRTFPNVRIGLMVGIGGGVPTAKRDIRLGDVVVALADGAHPAVLKYDSGRQRQDGTFEIVGRMNAPPRVLLTCVKAMRSMLEDEGNDLDRMVDLAVQKMKKSVTRAKYQRPEASTDVLYKADFVHPAEPGVQCAATCPAHPDNIVVRSPRLEDDDTCTIHYGPIGSADRVIMDARERDKLAKEHHILCCDMEAAGLMNQWPCMIIRGICDYADSHKNKQWQGYAAMVAAAYATMLLRNLLPNQVEASSTMKELLETQNKIAETLLDTNTLQMETLRLHNDKINHERHEKLTECIRAFKLGDYASYKNINRMRLPNTCQWVMENLLFSKWIVNTSGKVLWISADPGCGKSVLARSLIDDIFPKQCPGSSIYHFFFKDNDNQNRLSIALCSILHQLYTQNETLAEYAIPAWEKNGKTLLMESEPLWRILLASTADPAAPEVLCVFDALDEASRQDQMSLITFLGELQSGSHGAKPSRLRILVTSRPYQDIEHDFKRQIKDLPEIHLRGEEENKAISREIDMVIESRIQELASEHHLGSETAKKLGDELLNMKNRTYLWLHLIFQELEAQLTIALDPDAIELSAIPTSVEKAYEKLLDRTAAGQEVVVRTIFKLVVGAVRPLFIDELAMALGMATKSSYRTRAEATLPTTGLEARIRRLCGLFVFFSENKLYLIHQTAKEFLLRTSAPSAPSTWTFTIDEVHDTMALFLMRYLLLDDWTNPAVDTRMDSIFKYAAVHWPEHYRLVGQGSLARLHEIASRLWDLGDVLYSMWSPLYTDVNPQDNEARHRGSLAHAQCLAATTGHVSALLSMLPNSDEPVKSRDQNLSAPLKHAVRYGREEVVEMLLQKGADPDTDVGEVLLTLINGPSTDDEKSWLRRGANIDSESMWRGPALHFATCLESPAMAKMLIAAGANPDSRDRHDQTALVVAAYIGREAAVKMLIEEGVDVNAKGSRFGDALGAAAFMGRESIVKLLLRHHADVNAHQHSGTKYATPLQLAASRAQETMVNLLLREGAQVNAPGLYGSALQLAASKGSESIVKILLEKGAKIDAAGRDGTALHYAAYNGHEGVVRLLLDRGANINAPSRKGNAIHWAVENGHEGATKLLLDRGSNHNLRTNNGTTVLELALSKCHEGIVGMLVEKGAFGPQLAAKSENEAIVSRLLEQGADVNMPGEHGTALQHAIRSGSQSMVALLLKHGAKTSSWKFDGFANALEASAYQTGAVYETILPHSAGVTLPFGLTHAHAMAQCCRPETLADSQNLLDPTIRDMLGRSILHSAARNTNPESLRLVLAKSGGPDVLDEWDWTPLHWAAHYGNDVAVEALVEAGANTSTVDKSGFSPYKIASLAGHESTAKLLKSLQMVHADARLAEDLPLGTAFPGSCTCCKQNMYHEQRYCMQCGNFSLCYRCYRSAKAIHEHKYYARSKINPAASFGWVSQCYTR